jgi:hypothetical protein
MVANMCKNESEDDDVGSLTATFLSPLYPPDELQSTTYMYSTGYSITI